MLHSLVLVHVKSVCAGCMCLFTLGEEVSDVQLQRGNDFVKHLEFLSKARHLEDEAGGHLQL